MAENQLPKISQVTRDKLASYGFVNHLYDYLQLPSHYIPRGKGYQNYTYLIMGLSLVGGFFAKRNNFITYPFVVAFLLAPGISFYQKKEADFVYNSEYSKRHPEILLQHYPILKNSFKIVLNEVDTEIKALEEKIRVLEENAGRAN